MKLKVILILSILLFGFMAVALMDGYKHEPGAFAFENSDLIIESPYFETANAYKGQLHCHTTNSDGAQSPLEVVVAYKNAGYDFIAITDHDYVTPDPRVEGILFITGNEVSSSLGHMTTINGPSVPPSRNSQAVIDWTKAQCGLVWLAHPNWGWHHWTTEEMTSISGYHGIEVYNYLLNSRAEEKWDYVLTDLDRKITAIAVDDCHDVKNPKQFNGGWVMVFADSFTKAEILNNLGKGNFYSTQGPIINAVKLEGNTISIKLNQTSTVTWIGASGSILQETTGITEDSYVVRGNEKYVRIRVEGSGYAWTNPIYVSKTQPETVDAWTNFIHTYKAGGIRNHVYVSDHANSTAPGVPTNFTVNIQVKFGAQLVRNILVSLGDMSHLTDATGSAVFTGMSAGTYPLSVTVDDEVKYTGQLIVSQDASYMIDLTSQQPPQPPALHSSSWLEQNWIIAAFAVGMVIIATAVLLHKRR